MQEQLIAIGFLVSLQVVGGVVAGDGLRNLHEEQSWINRSQVIRGLIYAAFPWASWPARVAGAQLPLLLPAGLLLFVGAVVVGALALSPLVPWLVRAFREGTARALAIGLGLTLLGGCIAVGIAHAGTDVTTAARIVGLSVGALVGGEGLLLCFSGISELVYSG